MGIVGDVWGEFMICEGIYMLYMLYLSSMECSYSFRLGSRDDQISPGVFWVAQQTDRGTTKTKNS